MAKKRHRSVPIALAGMLIAVLAALLASAMPAAAQIVAPAGRTLWGQGVLWRQLVRFDQSTAADGASENRQVSTSSVVWGAAPNISLSFVAPLVTVRDSDGRRSSGTGPGTVLARWDVLRHNVAGGSTRLAPELGVRWPTGGPFGGRTVSYVGNLIFSHVRDPDWLIADVGLTVSPHGSERPGERWRFDLAYLRRVLPRRKMGVPSVLAVLEANAEWVRPADGLAAVPGAGSHTVYLSPGVEVIASARWIFELAAPIPIRSEHDAAHFEPEPSLVIGFRWLH